MKATSNSRNVIVGIFIIVGLAILILTILTLGSQRKTFADSVTVKSVFENVNGLQKGNNIWFSGVKVGTIKDVRIAGKGKVEVLMSIVEDSRQFIRKDARAKISTDGLIGNKIIEIYGGSLSSPQIEKGDILASDDLFSTDAMMKTLSKNNDNILQITNDFKVISSRLAAGEGSIGKLLTDETLVNQINTTTLTLQQAAKNLQTLTSNVADYTSKLNDKGTLANDLVTDTVIFQQLRLTVSQLKRVADSSQLVIRNLKNASNTLNKGLNNENSPIGMLLHDEQSAEKIKITLGNLESASQKLEEDLEALQHNFLFRGYFRKKAKREKESPRVVLDTLVGNN